MTAAQIHAKMLKLSADRRSAESKGNNRAAERIGQQLKGLAVKYQKALGLAKNPARKVAKKGARKNTAKKAATKKATRKNAARKVAKKGARKVAKKAARKGSTVKRPVTAARLKRRNGALAKAIEKYEEFHGRGPDVLTEVEVLETVDDTVSALGKLVSLEVAAIGGGVVEVKGFKGALLAQDVEGTQLYIVGGDQSVNPEDFGVSGERRYELLGVVEVVVYHTTKDHLGDDGGNADYHHEFGENGGKLPALIYDTVDQQLSLVGGDYRLLSVGIDD